MSRDRHHSWILVVTFLCLFFLAPFKAGAESKVAAIEVVGNKRIETGAIESKVRSKIGSALDSEVVREDIRTLFATGFFDDISVEQDPTAGGVKLIFKVVERPIIGKIEFKGVDSLEDDDKRDAVKVKEFEVLDIHKVNLTVEKMNEKYEEKGYYLADVRQEIQLDEKHNEATVIFHVQENDKVQVKEVNIIGNKLVPTDELKGVMLTKEGSPLSFLTGGGTYREAMFERDMAALGFYYGTLGYVRARFGKPEVSVSPDKKFVYITFFIDEGHKYSVGNVDFAGDLLFKRQELLDECELVTGETFNTETLRRETLRYTDKYGDLGYAFANVVPQPIIHDDTKTVDINFEVDRGERIYFGTITVTSNTKTKDKVLRRELTIFEGQLYSNTKKRESRENVLRLGFFDSVEFHQTTSKELSNVVDLEIRVKERSTGQLVVGAGYASGNIGFTAQAQLSQNNFLGNGQVASLSAQILTGRSFYEFNLGFQEPYVGASRWSLGGDLFQLKRSVFTLADTPTFDETKTGFDIKVGHPVVEFTNLYATYKFENSYVPESSIIDRRIITKESVNGIASSVTTTITYDKRDDRFDPRQGLYASLSGEYAGLGGIRKYFKSNLNVKFYHPIVWDFIFRFNAQGGNVLQTSGSRVPINELFIMGGIYTLRGYDYLSVGPKATISTNPNHVSAKAIETGALGREFVLGGHSQLLFNAEIEFPIFKEAKVRGVVFFDAGNAFDGFFSNLAPALMTNFGYGIRWFTPIGPLRFEFGYPMVNGGSPKFNFTIGQPF